MHVILKLLLDLQNHFEYLLFFRNYVIFCSLFRRNIIVLKVYTHLVPFDEEAEAYNHAVAKDDKEAGELLDQGVRYEFTTPQGKMIFIKAKKKL
jgi:hypothetical protein